MNREYVDSSNIRSIGYDRGTLEIEFHSGGIYQYSNVPETVYASLITADSHGRYFNAHIKNIYHTTPIR